MKTVKTGIILLFISAFFASCGVDMFNRIDGNRNVISEKRKINDDFTRVKVSSGIDLYIKQGNKVSLTVEADENLHDYIITEVHGDQLKIYVDGNIWRAKARKVYLTVTTLEELKATSGSDVYSQSVIRANDLEVSTSSGADMRIEVDADNVVSSSSSGSDLRISGKSNTHSTSATSGSSIYAYKLESKDVTAKVSSGADIGVYASESINARASSGGDIRYKGNPEKVNKKTSSGGGVSSRY
ncbi:head GIN domain-containing protein [Pseudotenacibaculum sp. MALMAid0570]|uniref:head GIN domain-containing protein n=1 Tax=Pseudotenacibaculum sp. MALMAid0570 TaxID=3143938 RepID=UPI0032DE4E98